MHKRAFLMLFVLLLNTGCGGKKPKFTAEQLAQMPLSQRESLPEPSGGFVLAVAGQTVTSDEVIAPTIERLKPFAQRTDADQFKQQARSLVENVVIRKVSDILLYQHAKKDMSEKMEEALDKAAEAEVRKFIVHFEGDYAKAESALEQMGMDWAGFKEHQKKMILGQSYIQSQVPQHDTVTYSDLINCYNDMKDEFFAVAPTMKFRLIDIEPQKLNLTNPHSSKGEKAGELADELAKRLKAGEDFGELAKQYSHGHRASFGGLWESVRPDSLATPYDILALEAQKLQPGQIAGPIEAGDHFFIMKLEEKTAENFKPLDEVQKIVEAKIIFDRRKAALDELGNKLVQQAALTDTDVFIDFCLEKIYRQSNQ